MNQYLTIDDSINLANTIIKSCNEMFSYLHRDMVVNESINNTISHIFKFLEKVLKTMPELLITKSIHKHKREDLMLSYEKVIETWAEYLFASEDFYNSWYNFVNEWKIYLEILTKVKDSGKTIFISLN